MNRRDVLRLTGAAGALAVAGCLGGDGSDDETGDGTESTPTPTQTQTQTQTPTQTPTAEEAEDTDDESTEDGSNSGSESSGEYVYEDPVAAVEAFVQAYQDGDVEGLNTLIHDEGTVEPIPQDVTSEDLQQSAPEITEIGGSAVEDGLATVEAEIQSPDSDSPVTTTFRLTNVDGGWRISDIESEQSDSPVPRASFDYDFDDGTATITHESGDSIPAGQLYVRGDGVETGVWHELAEDSDLGPDDTVQAGMSLTVEVDGEFSIQIVWESDGQSATLASVSGESGSGSGNDTDSGNG
jgi:hypothetical protein